VRGAPEAGKEGRPLRRQSSNDLDRQGTNHVASWQTTGDKLQAEGS
jgi:hypothetical protein